MNESDYLPVKPNINNTNVNRPVQKKPKDIFEDNKDSDVNIILNKKVDVLEMKSTPTKEELLSKQNLPESPKGVSWVIIGLSVIIIILIVIVIYYVLQYNNVIGSLNPVINKKDVYPSYDLKPDISPNINSDDKNKSLSMSSDDKKSKMYKKATKDDIDKVLDRLSTIKEEEEPVETPLKPSEKITEIIDSDEVSEAEVDEDSDDNCINADEDYNNADEDYNNVKELLLGDDFSDDGTINNMDTNAIEKFSKQALQ